MAAPPYKTNHVQIFVDDLREIEAALSPPVQELPEAARFEVTIEGVKGDAKSMRSQAHVETTITGVKWTLTGELAVALLRALKEQERT